MKRLAISGLKGLYAITPDEPDTATLIRQVEAALRGGAQVLQYRNKSASAELQVQQAALLRRLAHSFQATFIVNDNAALAAEVGADGVHIGGEDGSVAEARKYMGHAGVIGVSCYNRLSLAHEAVQQGADYVAFGAFFPSGVKPQAVQAEVALLETARRELKVPIVAIGGITAKNGKQLVRAGADALAVISALWNARDIEQAAQDFSNLF